MVTMNETRHGETIILTKKIKFEKQDDILLLYNIIKCKESKEL